MVLEMVSDFLGSHYLLGLDKSQYLVIRDLFLERATPVVFSHAG
jgi:hypothetical protein